MAAVAVPSALVVSSSLSTASPPVECPINTVLLSTFITSVMYGSQHFSRDSKGSKSSSSERVIWMCRSHLTLHSALCHLTLLSPRDVVITTRCCVFHRTCCVLCAVVTRCCHHHTLLCDVCCHHHTLLCCHLALRALAAALALHSPRAAGRSRSTSSTPALGIGQFQAQSPLATAASRQTPGHGFLRQSQPQTGFI